jgi:hypothetical protein
MLAAKMRTSSSASVNKLSSNSGFATSGVRCTSRNHRRASRNSL